MRTIHICTISNNAPLYEGMRRSFLEAGFTEDRFRYTLLDNTQCNRYDPYRSLSDTCAETEEPYLVFCHQDVRLNQREGFERLTDLLNELESRDPRWALAGNAGVDIGSGYVLRITDPNTPNARRGDYRRAVQSLDENFLIIKTAVRLRCSTELSGFHFYATDLCTHAIRRGFTCYVLDFHLSHYSAGRAGSPEFQEAKARFQARWNPHFHLHFLQTPCTGLFLSRHRVLHRFLNRPEIINWVASHPRRYRTLLTLATPLRALSSPRLRHNQKHSSSRKTDFGRTNVQ